MESLTQNSEGTGEDAYSVMNDVLVAVHSQLQFAEAKNGALLAVNLATVVGVGAILASDQVAIWEVRAWLFVTIFGLAGAALIALSSFLPVMGPHRHQFAAGTEHAANLVFWGEIARTSPAIYAADLFKAVGKPGEPSRLHLDLADQIVVNSGIARRKFTRFQPAAIVTCVSVVLPAAVLSAYWIAQRLGVLP